MKSSAKGKGKTKTRIVTTYLPPELAAELDGLMAAEGGSRSGWLRTAVETYVVDAEWHLACGLSKDLAVCLGHDPEKVERRIAELRANPPPGYPGLSPRLRYEFDLDDERAAHRPAGVNVIGVPQWHEPPAERPLTSVPVCLSPQLAAMVDGMIAGTDIRRSALLRALFRFYLRDRAREQRILENEKRIRALGIAPEDVVRLVKECRAEMRAEKSA